MTCPKSLWVYRYLLRASAVFAGGRRRDLTATVYD
jgi:hypothetical protein